MQIVKVTTSEGRAAIPLKGWESVRKAICAYEGGKARGSRETTRETADAIQEAHGSSGSLAVGMFMLGGAIASTGGKLVQNLLADAEKKLKNDEHFTRSYDYDGMGTAFLKTSVDIDVLDREQDMFALRIYAAYVGDEPEQALAEYFNIPRCLVGTTVDVEVKPEDGDRFAFDFEQIVRVLDGTLGTGKISGAKIAKAMLLPEKERESTPRFTLLEKDGLLVQILPGRVARRIEYVRGEGSRDTWSVKGSVLSGNLERDFSSEDPDSKVTPTFRICVTTNKKRFFDRYMPIWDPAQQTQAIALMKQIAAALK